MQLWKLEKMCLRKSSQPSRKSKATVNLKTGSFNGIQCIQLSLSAVTTVLTTTDCTALLTLPMMTAGSMLSNRPVLRFTMAVFFLLKLITSFATKIKSNLHYTRRNTPKRVTSCGTHLRGLAPGLHSSEETSQRWRVVGDTVPI